jgi:hypothetical protein
MLRRTHGFDLCDGNGAVLFFDSYEASFMQDSMVTGRDGLGQAIWLFNTAFGEADFLDELDPQPIWGFHMDYQMSGTVVGGASPEMEFYRIYNDTGTPIMSLYQRGDGLMEIWNNGGSIAVSNILYPFVPGTWATLELYGTFSIGSDNTIELRQNGVQIAKVTGVNWGIAGTAEFPYIMGFRWAGFGPPGIQVDNYIVYDGQVDGPQAIATFTGRVRITSLYPQSELQTAWLRNANVVNYPNVADRPDAGYSGVPDGNGTYIYPPPSEADQFFGIGRSPCYGLVLGLSVNFVAAPQDESYCTCDVLLQEQGTNYDLAEFDMDGPSNDGEAPGYSGYQVCLETSPATSTNFVDGEISSAFWGLGSTVGTDFLVTQFFLEKVVDLTGKPYTCGQASYAY